MRIRIVVHGKRFEILFIYYLFLEFTILKYIILIDGQVHQYGYYIFANFYLQFQKGIVFRRICLKFSYLTILRAILN